MVYTLPANAARVEADRAALEAIEAKSYAERAAGREKEIADSGDSDFTRLRLAEGRFIDLAIHKDTFLDDSAIRTDLDVSTPLAWKSRYEPTVGVTTGSVYGGPLRTLYATQDNYALLTPFVVDAEEVTVPRMALTQDPEKLGQREAALRRQAEAMKLKMETYLINFLTGQPLGTDLATSITNFVAAGNPYNDKTVYVADPGVQSGTYETSNILSFPGEGGLTPRFFEEIINQMFLTKRVARTIHIPVAGMPWRKLMRYATVVSNALNGANGTASNPGLQAIPAPDWQKLFNMDMGEALTNGLVLQIFGHTFKVKANNALPQGYAVITTDQPGAEIFNILDKSVSTDIVDPREQYFVGHYEKREMAIAVPDPWLRNTWFAYFGNTAGL